MRQVFQPASLFDVSVTTYTYAPDSNRLTTVDDGTGPVSFEYDAAGNTLTDGNRQFTYDARNRMATADGHAYGYNALGQRAFKPRFGVAGDATGDGQVTEADLALLQQALRGEVSGTMAMDCNGDGIVDNKDTSCLARKIGAFKNQGQHRRKGAGGPPTADEHTATPVQVGWVLFTYDEAGRLIGEYDEAGNPIRRYVWLEDLPIAVISTEGIQYLHADHLNTPKVVTDQQGTVVWQADYQPFGQVTESGEFELNLRFPGQYHDRETGLHQNWHREYMPELGRYSQSDPIGIDDGMNTYVYVRSNPIRNADPTGLLVAIVGHIAARPAGYITNPDSYHLALYLKPDCPCDGIQSTTLGAQWSLDGLVGVRDHPGDSVSNAQIFKIVGTPSGMSDCDFIKRLIDIAESYDGSLPYSFPNINPRPLFYDGLMDSGTYNSNSFVSGVLRAAGATPPPLGGRGFQVPGYANPIPIGGP